MTQVAFNTTTVTASVILFAVGLGVVRLWLWRRAASPADRGPAWRFGLLIALQIAAGGHLHLSFYPPIGVLRLGTLVIATADSSASTRLAPGETLVALPEARIAGAARAPDLATAFRQNANVARIRIVGSGLPPRDQGRLPFPIVFIPPPTPPGLVEFAPPERVAPGQAFSVGGRIGSLAAGTVELVDPAGRVAARTRVIRGQRFSLSGTARAEGLALFDLRLKDPAGALIEHVDVPLEARAQPQPRILVLAGAPNAEVKYLRRWAEDSDIELDVDIDLGAGVGVTDEQTQLTPTALGELDLVIIDDRRWEDLGSSARSALLSAVNNGLGLLLRPTGPLSPSTRRDWSALGLPLNGPDASRPVRLAGDPLPPATPEPVSGNPVEGSSELVRRDILTDDPRVVRMVNDASGLALAAWRPRGVGRLGVWTITDSYVLTLSGRVDRYGALWSEIFSALARPVEQGRVLIDAFPRVGERVAVCGAGERGRVMNPSGRMASLVIDPSSRGAPCAGYWPIETGWHAAWDGSGRQSLFYVHPANAAPSLRRASLRSETLALARAGTHRPRIEPGYGERGPSWPWFFALLVVFAALWWLERKPWPKTKTSV